MNHWMCFGKCGSVGWTRMLLLWSLLSGYASVGALLHGKEIHCYATKCILNRKGSHPGEDLMVINGLIDMYAKYKSTKVARMMFDSIAPEGSDVVTWTVMIGEYAQHGEANDALVLFSKMLGQENFSKPNAFTIACALVACSRLGALRFGK
jgi:pentatricopeptide repeat protein